MAVEACKHTCSRARLSAWNMVDRPSVSMEIQAVRLQCKSDRWSVHEGHCQAACAAVCPCITPLLLHEQTADVSTSQASCTSVA